jgi:hypothetical protein
MPHAVAMKSFEKEELWNAKYLATACEQELSV